MYVCYVDNAIFYGQTISNFADAVMVLVM